MKTGLQVNVATLCFENYLFSFFLRKNGLVSEKWQCPLPETPEPEKAIKKPMKAMKAMKAMKSVKKKPSKK